MIRHGDDPVGTIIEIKTMFIIGITGSIATGKTFVSQYFKQQGASIFDADNTVHDLMENDAQLMASIASHFPDAVMKNEINRSLLGQIVFANPLALKTLESLIHPVIRQKEIDFITREKTKKTPFIILDIPLLFETGAETLCDYVIVTSCLPDIQRSRIESRGMNDDQLQRVLARQLPDEEKRKRADFVVDTGGSEDETTRQIAEIIARMKGSDS